LIVLVYRQYYRRKIYSKFASQPEIAKNSLKPRRVSGVLYACCVRVAAERIIRMTSQKSSVHRWDLAFATAALVSHSIRK